MPIQSCESSILLKVRVTQKSSISTPHPTSSNISVDHSDNLAQKPILDAAKNSSGNIKLSVSFPLQKTAFSTGANDAKHDDYSRVISPSDNNNININKQNKKNNKNMITKKIIKSSPDSDAHSFSPVSSAIIASSLSHCFSFSFFSYCSLLSLSLFFSSLVKILLNNKSDKPILICSFVIDVVADHFISSGSELKKKSSGLTCNNFQFVGVSFLAGFIRKLINF